MLPSVLIFSSFIFTLCFYGGFFLSFLFIFYLCFLWKGLLIFWEALFGHHMIYEVTKQVHILNFQHCLLFLYSPSSFNLLYPHCLLFRYSPSNFNLLYPRRYYCWNIFKFVILYLLLAKYGLSKTQSQVCWVLLVALGVWNNRKACL